MEYWVFCRALQFATHGLLSGWLALVVWCADVSAQSSAPAPNGRDLGSVIPALSQARPAEGTLFLQAAPGKREVVRFYGELGDARFVMRPTGEITLVPASETRPTDEEFITATHDDMIVALKKAGFADYKFAEAKPYLFVYDCGEGFYLHTRSILESMLPGVVASLKSWGQNVVRPNMPMVVIIVPSREAYDALHKMPDEIIAYYNQLTNYVVLYEDQELWDAAPEFAAKQACYTIAHEGIHQLLANTGIQARLASWPMWVSEGLPEYYCPLKVNSNLIKKGDAELPTRTIKWNKPGMVNDLRMHELLQMGAGSGEAVRTLVQANDLNSSGYALAWGLVHYLANEEPEKFRAYLKDLSTYRPLDRTRRNLTGRTDPNFVKHFGEDYAALEQAIQQHLTSKSMEAEYVDPIENQTHYVVRSVQKKGRAFRVSLIVTTSPAAAKQWKEEQEAGNKKAKFFTKICKSRHEAEREVAKLQSR